eukprot:2893829-Pyramimonas_sp.AAC.1
MSYRNSGAGWSQCLEELFGIDEPEEFGRGVELVTRRASLSKGSTTIKTLGGTAFEWQPDLDGNRKIVIFRVFRLSEASFMCSEERSARKELYEVPGGNLVDGLPPVHIIPGRWRASWLEKSRRTFC